MEINMALYSEYINKAAEILPKGAFLTTSDGSKVNTMTIGWGTFGFQWGIPTAEVMVRQSRFTKEILDKTMEFTLTFPLDSSMQKELGGCGQKSGRDCDKFKEFNLSINPAKEISTPVVACKSIVFECKVVSKTEMAVETTSSEILDKWYKNGDLHTIYYAKVLACYETE